MSPQCLDIIKFQQRCDPIRDNLWGLDCPITQNNIQTAIDTNNLLYPKVWDGRGTGGSSRSDHIARIAWFVTHDWNDPINVDVGVPSLGCYPKWPLEDGNHRFAAAIIRGDNFILANMSGAINEIRKFLREAM